MNTLLQFKKQRIWKCIFKYTSNNNTYVLLKFAKTIKIPIEIIIKLFYSLLPGNFTIKPYDTVFNLGTRPTIFKCVVLNTTGRRGSQVLSFFMCAIAVGIQ